MIGFINKITATPGSRAALLALVVTGAEDMPGCIAYIAAGDGSDPDVIWVSEVWVDKARVRTHNQNMTVAARIMAFMKTLGHRS